MTLQRIRFIDYWIGIPLCFLFSIIYYLAEIVSKKTRKKNMPRKVLFILLSEMGSGILAYPAIKQFKEYYPTVTAYFFTFQKNEEGIHLLNIISAEQIVSIRDTCLWHLFCDVLKGIIRIRREKIDTVIDMELFSRCSSIVSFLSGALIRIGFHKYTMEGLYRGSLHTHRVTYNPYIHISQNFIALVEALEVNPVDVPLLKKPVRQHDGNLPLTSISAEERDALRARLQLLCPSYIPTRQIVVMHIEMNDNLPVRKWPFESYMMLAEK
ncbi:MAG: hypothetical protein KKH94_07850 [Candidatus Omnitrophica bacterium]|nr:hypothetical protein [Candidatus Omnitrophota bacterium]